MKVLCLGLPFGASLDVLEGYSSARGHEVRTAGIDQQADYILKKRETAASLVTRVRRDWPVDCVICWCPEVNPPPFEIEACPVKTAAVVSDWNVYFPQIEYNLSRYDVVVTDRLGAQTLQLAGAAPHYLCPIYAHQPKFHRPLGLARDIDVAFAGNLNHAVHVRRGRLLERIAALSERRRIVIASGLPPEQYASLLNQTRIAFNCALRREMNLRCFEALACGALLFLEADNLEAREWLRDGEDAVFYEEDTLTPLIESYLERPEEAARIAANGQALIQERLSVSHRLDMILDFIAAQPAEARHFNALPKPEKSYHEILQYASSMVPFHKRHTENVLDRASKSYPEHPGIQTSHSLVLAVRAGQQQRRGLPVVSALQKYILQMVETALLENDAVALWLNLGQITFAAGKYDAAKKFLESAMSKPSIRWAGLLIGGVNDPYYARIREHLARNCLNSELLWAMAAANRAEIALEEMDHPRVRAYARRAIKWAPDIPAPYLHLARAELQSGKPEAALDALEKSAALSSFDADHRALRIQALKALSRPGEARSLAEESIRIFQAWQGAEHAVDRFRKILASLEGQEGLPY